MTTGVCALDKKALAENGSQAHTELVKRSEGGGGKEGVAVRLGYWR